MHACVSDTGTRAVVTHLTPSINSFNHPRLGFNCHQTAHTLAAVNIQQEPTTNLKLNTQTPTYPPCRVVRCQQQLLAQQTSTNLLTKNSTQHTHANTHTHLVMWSAVHHSPAALARHCCCVTQQDRQEVLSCHIRPPIVDAHTLIHIRTTCDTLYIGCMCVFWGGGAAVRRGFGEHGESSS